MVSLDKSQQFRNIILDRYQTRNEKPPETRSTSTLMTQDLFIAQANMIVCPFIAWIFWFSELFKIIFILFPILGESFETIEKETCVEF